MNVEVIVCTHAGPFVMVLSMVFEYLIEPNVPND